MKPLPDLSRRVPLLSGGLAMAALLGAAGWLSAGEPAELPLQALPAKWEAAAKKFIAKRHPWAKFGKGSWVTMRTTTTVGGEAKVRLITTRLVRLGSKQCTVALFDGGGSSTKKISEVKYWLQAPACLLHEAVPGEKASPPKLLGARTVKAAGKKIPCAVYEMPTGFQVFVRRLFVSKEGFLVQKTNYVKRSGKLTRPNTEILTKLDVPVKISGRTFQCRLYEQQGGETGSYKTYRCADLPGGVARTEDRSRKGGPEETIISEAVDWKIVAKKP